MQFEFDANQGYQRDAIDAVVKLFDGQRYVPTELQFGDSFDSPAIGNHLDLDSGQISANLEQIQKENEIITGTPALNGTLHFSVEMETGTGKTYIYLRTASGTLPANTACVSSSL